MDRVRAIGRWFTNLSRRAQIIAAIVALVVVCGTCGGVLAAIGAANPQPSTSGTAQATSTATARITQAHATATTVPATATHPAPAQPRFGGHVADFTARFGQPNDHSANGTQNYARYPNSNIDEIILLPDLTDGAAYSTLVVDLTVQAPDAGWSLSTAESTCAPYLPADAQASGQPVQVTASGVSGIQGIDQRYHSASLGTELPAAQFVDAAQNPVASGTFDVYYAYHGPDQSSQIVSCRMLPGTQQTTA